MYKKETSAFNNIMKSYVYSFNMCLFVCLFICF